MRGEFGGEWIHVYAWLKPFAVPPETITTLLISSTPIQKIRKDVQVIKNSKKWKWCWKCWGKIVTLFEGQGLPFKVHRRSIESLKRYHGKGGGGLVPKLCPILATPWTVACQAPLSMGFPRQEYWNGCHFLLQGIFPILNRTQVSCTTGRFFTNWATREVHGKRKWEKFGFGDFVLWTQWWVTEVFSEREVICAWGI